MHHFRVIPAEPLWFRHERAPAMRDAARESSLPLGRVAGVDAAPMAPRVLVVEDDADGRDPLAEILGLEGYTVTGAADGATAIGQLGDGFDVVVLDLGLPDVAGVDVIRAARALPDGPAVVVFSGHHRLRADAEAAGCAAFVLKPDLDKLLAVIEAHVLGQAVAAKPGSGKQSA